MNRFFIIASTLLFFLVLAAKASAGEEFCVSNSIELQQAMTVAATNDEDDTIKVAQGTYTGNFIFDSFEGKSITLLGGYSADCTSRSLNPSNTILDGKNTGRVLFLNNSAGGDIYIEGFKIKNGFTTGRGGGIYAASYYFYLAGTITITNNVINKNTAADGGGIFVWTDSNNEDYAFIGKKRQGFDASFSKREKITEQANEEEGDIFIIDNLITRNTGEGVWAYTTGDLYAGSVFVLQNTVTENNGTGVVAISQVGNVHIRKNSITKNTTDGNGGGVFAGSYLYLGGGGNLFLTNNIIAENSSVDGGGVYAITNGDYVAGYLNVVNNTITGNSCSNSGGGVYLYGFLDSMLNVYNNIIWRNTATNGGDIKLDFGPLDWVETSGYNNDYSSLSGTWTHAAKNIDINPQFIDPATDDYHLQSTSRCIDLGENTAPGLPEKDYDGEPRVFDGNDDNTATVDIGADEYIGVALQQLTISSSLGGNTEPASGEYIYVQGKEVDINATPAEYYRFDGWTGDIPSGHEKDNPLILTMDKDKTIEPHFIRIIYPPTNVTGQKVLNRSLSQAEYINIISWEANRNNQDVNISRYRIYTMEGNDQSLLVEVDDDTFQYWHRNVEKERSHEYVLAAVGEDGREGDSIRITIH